jgi:hypothetical protein
MNKQVREALQESYKRRELLEKFYGMQVRSRYLLSFIFHHQSKQTISAIISALRRFYLAISLGIWINCIFQHRSVNFSINTAQEKHNIANKSTAVKRK